MGNIKYVFRGYGAAFSIIEEKELKIFYMLPGMIAILLLMLFYFVSSKISFSLFNKLSSMVDLENYHMLAYYLIKFLIIAIAFMFYFLIYKGLILILLSPFLSYISEKTEEEVEHSVMDVSFKKNVKLFTRGAIVSSKYLIFEISGAIVIFLLGFIPILNLLSPLLLLILEGFFAGASLIDYTLERRELNSTQSFQFVKKNFLFTTLNGIIFILFMMVPIIGIFMSPLVSCVAVTKSTLDLIDNKGI